VAGVIVIGSRTRTLPAPPHIVWASLVSPPNPVRGQWLHLLDDEREPTVLDADVPSRVVRSSLWPSRPRDQALLELTGARSQTPCGSRCSPRTIHPTRARQGTFDDGSTTFSSPTCGSPTDSNRNSSPGTGHAPDQEQGAPLDADPAAAILEFRALVRIAWSPLGQTRDTGAVSIFPGQVVVSESPLSGYRRRLIQTSPRVQVVRTRLALPGSNLHLVAWEGSRFATAVLLPSDVPHLRSALYDDGFTMDYRTQWIFTLSRPPADTTTRHPGIAGKTIHVNKNSHHREDGEQRP
jgi:hypothetical protein